jgi:hypothetical protein
MHNLRTKRSASVFAQLCLEQPKLRQRLGSCTVAESCSEVLDSTKAGCALHPGKTTALRPGRAQEQGNPDAFPDSSYIRCCVWIRIGDGQEGRQGGVSCRFPVFAQVGVLSGRCYLRKNISRCAFVIHEPLYTHIQYFKSGLKIHLYHLKFTVHIKVKSLWN